MLLVVINEDVSYCSPTFPPVLSSTISAVRSSYRSTQNCHSSSNKSRLVALIQVVALCGPKETPSLRFTCQRAVAELHADCRLLLAPGESLSVVNVVIRTIFGYFCSSPAMSFRPGIALSDLFFSRFDSFASPRNDMTGE